MLREAVESGTGRDGQVDWPSVAAEMGESPARCRRRWESHTKPAGWAHVVRSNMPAEEPPAYAPTMYEARRSETIQNRRLQASDAVLRGRLRPVLNTPTARPAKPRRRDRVPLVGGDTRLARWQASYGIAAADWPEPGRPETCFRGITMTMHNGGDWTRMKLRSAGVTEEYWAPERIWAEIKAWVLVAKEDWRRHGEGGQPHRDRVRTLIIPQEAIVGYGDGESGDVIWDLRAMWTAAATGHVAPIVPLDVDADAEHRLNTARLRARLEQAGIGDSDAVEQLTAQGMRTDTTCRRDIVLHKNYPKAGEYAELCAALVEREAATSPGKPPIVSAASPVIDFVPTRSHPSNVVEGKKPRIVRDLRAPRNARDGGGENSVNAGIDLGDPDSFDPLELTSPLQFAAEVDILRAMMATGSLTVDIGTSDYARYYRQLMAALEDYWAQSFIIDAAGVRTDRATTFGGGAACHRGNEAADLLLELVVDEFTKTLAAFERQWDAGELTRLMREARAVAGTQKLTELSAAEWERVSRLLAVQGVACTPQEARFAAETKGPAATPPARPVTAAETAAIAKLPAVRAAQRRRRAALAITHPELTEAEVGRQCRPLVIQAFFDDSLIATVSQLFAVLVAAMLCVADDIALEIAVEKIHLGTADGRTGPLRIEQWTRHRVVDFELRPGDLVGLGKAIQMTRRRVRDTEATLDKLAEKIDGLESAVRGLSRGGGGWQRIAKQPLRKTLGLGFFVATTEPNGRAELNLPVRALKGANDEEGVWTPESEEALRTLLNTARDGEGVAFSPLDAVPGMEGRRVVWVIEDAAGLRKDGKGEAAQPLPLSEQGGRGAIFYAGVGPAEDATTCFTSPLGWCYTPWTPEQLQLNSTVLEGINSTENVARVLEGPLRQPEDAAVGIDVVECLDSLAFVYIGRKMRSSRPELAELLVRRSALLQRHPNARLFLLHFDREYIDAADGVSKADVNEDGQTGLDRANRTLAARGMGQLTPENRL